MKLRVSLKSMLLVCAMCIGTQTTIAFEGFGSFESNKDKLKSEAQTIRRDKSLSMESITSEELAILKEEYKDVTKETRLIIALNFMKESLGNYSRKAILGANMSGRPIKVSFKNLSEMGMAYADFDALGWKKKKDLYIFINEKHKDAPPIALAALLSHEALHQDEFNSINEETYAWTLEAAVWTQLSEDYHEQVANSNHPLTVRENMLKKLFIKGNYTDKYIRKTVSSNPGYSNLPSRSPGFEDSL